MPAAVIQPAGTGSQPGEELFFQQQVWALIWALSPVRDAKSRAQKVKVLPRVCEPAHFTREFYLLAERFDENKILGRSFPRFFCSGQFRNARPLSRQAPVRGHELETLWVWLGLSAGLGGVR